MSRPTPSRDKKRVDLAAVRRAVADYMSSEGCSCCRGSNHAEHAAVLAELLEVPMYDDKSGWNFPKFRTQQ